MMSTCHVLIKIILTNIFCSECYVLKIHLLKLFHIIYVKKYYILSIYHSKKPHVIFNKKIDKNFDILFKIYLFIIWNFSFLLKNLYALKLMYLKHIFNNYNKINEECNAEYFSFQRILENYLCGCDILYINNTNLQICLLIMMKIIFPILIKIYFSIMMKSCFLTARFMKIYYLEITISLIIKKMCTSNFICNAHLKQIFFVKALYALDFKCLKYIPNKYVLILSVVINLSVMHSICCKQGQYSWFQYTSFNLIQVTILVCLKIVFLFFKCLKNILSLHSILKKYE